MRHALVCVLMTVSVVAPLAAEDMTVILEFDGPYSERSLLEMKRETQAVMKNADLKLEWRLVGDTGHESFHDLVVVRFKGKCVFTPAPYLYDERGALAFTYSTSGEIQPYSEVSCDRVAAAIRPAMTGQYSHADMLMGRALGRVVAHELMHMKTRSASHGRRGVGKPGLTGTQLIGDELGLEPSDAERIVDGEHKR